MKRNTLFILLKTFIILVTILLVACQTDTTDTPTMKPGDPVEFGAYIHESSKVRMRGTEGLDSIYLSSSPFDMDFYIQLCCDNGDKTTKVGTYVVPSGFEGRLRSKKDENRLEWEDLTSNHTFYAWNIPWNQKNDYDENTKYNPMETDITKGLNIKFYDSAEKTGYDKYKNNDIYENFIGAKSAEPYSYKKHGKYVDLTFHHLVSKIVIGSFVLIKSEGSIQKNLKADLTFVGMPTKATFYPHPTEGGRPCVTYNSEDVSKDAGVTYYIDHEIPDDVFYICPEVDFSNIDFKVKLNNEEYKDYDTYYGTFDNVEFKREGKAYDQKGDEKILHAGEMMTLDITLIPGKGPGLSITIADWSTEALKESQYHTYAGIYSNSEINELLDVFLHHNGNNFEDIEDAIERLVEMYGYKDDDGKYVFPLYDDITIDSNIFPIWRNCIIDGRGHTITIKTNVVGNVHGDHPYYNLGPVRDVYFTDPNGKNTIYIDSDGFVWIADPDYPGDYKKAENPKNPGEYYYLAPLVDPYKSYDIDSVTGEVKLSDYYH